MGKKERIKTTKLAIIPLLYRSKLLNYNKSTQVDHPLESQSGIQGRPQILYLGQLDRELPTGTLYQNCPPLIAILLEVSITHRVINDNIFTGSSDFGRVRGYISNARLYQFL